MYKCVLAVLILLSGCKSLPTPLCHGKAYLGGEETIMPIYGIKKSGKYKLYHAGHHYNWRWVGAGAFDSTTCSQIM
ncbi:hypothetical protein NKK09_004536 [Escherichia coli]|jgi:hypothetical protein|uniref:Lipoprotein n=1 Tax=Escherichia coli O104:H4 (strain 2011C-3493) TaxID=1133852 RepID=A0A0E0Y0J4_ECO1C|nr:hypothetical protein [Escherichia coli]EEZ8897889.1 hypothetical protein [Escherichia coli O104]EFZ8624209.1 hypothetical protein [Shigella dysenteriae]EGR60406.1 hypothetical protein HUSEC41_25702 [Escherichia coli O104:H4 str. 01-09591]EGR70929.1 hypothetical protein HUSEC_28362 [Escherichia coli O104:H4 str. LB226692]HDQ6478834.1 hypothetical protein [Escherichia coli O104:H4 str. 11-3798]HDQ7007824.1 hypothetical protein [Escherichia coli O104:H4 str. Ec11-5537]HDQ7046124.1 hypothetic